MTFCGLIIWFVFCTTFNVFFFRLVSQQIGLTKLITSTPNEQATNGRSCAKPEECKPFLTHMEQVDKLETPFEIITRVETSYSKTKFDESVHEKIPVLKEETFFLDDIPILNDLTQREKCIVFSAACICASFFIIVFVLASKYIWRKYLTYLKSTLKNPPATPKVFAEGMNVTKWLDNLEAYMLHINLKSDNSRGSCMIQQMDADSRKHLENVNTSFTGDKLANTNYTQLKKIMQETFATKRISLREHRLTFLMKKQADDEKVQRFYATLLELVDKGFAEAPKSFKDDLIHEQFIYGLSHQNIRENLLADYGTESNLQKIVEQANKQEALILSDRNKRSSSSSQDTTKEVKQSNNPVEAKIVEPKLAEVASVKAIEQARQQEYAEDQITSDSIHPQKEIAGICMINEQPVRYIVDTGSQVTIVHERAIRKQQTFEANDRLCTANGQVLHAKIIKNCQIKVGDFSCVMDIYISHELKSDCLIGMDLLAKCPMFNQFVNNLNKLSQQSQRTSTHKSNVDNDALIAASIPSDVKESNQAIVQTICCIFAGLISNGLFDLTTTNAIKHRIQIRQDAEPIKQRMRPVPFKYKEEFTKQIREMVEHKIIRPSTSSWCSPINLVKKPDDTIRVTQDFRKVNAVTIKDAFPLPNINSMLNQLGQAVIYSTLDLTHGYYQIPLEEKSKRYTAFGCECGFFEFNVLAMGLTNACETFQRMMSNVLQELIGVCCFVYLDDVIVYSASVDEHVYHLRQVAERLRNANLKVKVKKCKFLQAKIKFLSHIIERGTIKPNPDKVASLREFKTPTTTTEAQSFMGLANYYHKFIPNFATLASPIFLVYARTPLEWNDECQQAFEQLRNALTSETVLILPNFDLPFLVETDASNYGVGGVLSQAVSDGVRPVAYFSKHLNAAQRRYSTSERELLAIVLTLEHFRQFLYGQQFDIITDHEPLKHLVKTPRIAPKLARWVARIQLFDYKIRYRRGEDNGGADGLSRLALEPEVKEDEEEDLFEIINNIIYNDQTQINTISISIGVQPEHKTIVPVVAINAINVQANLTNKRQLEDLNIKWIYDLKLQAYMKREHHNPTMTITFDSKEKEAYYKQWYRIRIVNKSVYREYIDTDGTVHLQYIVPFDNRLRVLKQAHDALCGGGHKGRDKTIEHLKKRCYWPTMIADVDEYVKHCLNCQSAKDANVKNKAPLQSIRPTLPFQIVTADIAGPITKTPRGYQYILVIADHFTKWVQFYPLKSMLANELAEKFSSYFCQHGPPDQLHTDQGTNFQSKTVAELCELWDVRQTRTTPYHPQSDGLSERTIRTCKQMMRCYAKANSTEWDLILPFLQYAFNTAVHSTTSCTPFELVYGRQARVPLDVIEPAEMIDLGFTPEEYAENVEVLLKEAYQMVNRKRDTKIVKQKLKYDRHARAGSYEQGDFVMLKNHVIKKNETKSLRKPWLGPYRVLQKIDEKTYLIKHVMKTGPKKVVSFDQLKACYYYIPLVPVVKAEPDDQIIINSQQSEEQASVMAEVPQTQPKRGRPKKQALQNAVVAPLVSKRRGRPPKKSKKPDGKVIKVPLAVPIQKQRVVNARYNLRHRKF